jgi:hypothetical protein
MSYFCTSQVREARVSVCAGALEVKNNKAKKIAERKFFIIKLKSKVQAHLAHLQKRFGVAACLAIRIMSAL